VAALRTFAAGATIMQQGESADYVIVLLGGRAKICIHKNGGERVIAERGRGQLIGERGALQVSVRSATVIAVEMIYALVIKTKDFAEFISGNPRILEFVQGQSRDRGTYEPDKSVNPEEEPVSSRSAASSGMDAGDSEGASAKGDHALKGENCTVVLTDVVAFGAHKRTDNDRLIIRQALSEMVQEAVQGLYGARLEDRGDGILIVVPPKIPTATVLDRMLSVLPFSLDQHNRGERNPAQFQLRLSIDVGPVVSDAMGVSGEALIVAARLVEASALKEAFTGSTVRLGVIVSSFIYDAVVKHDQDQAYVASYSPVSISVKESRTTAWMKLIG
jgi:class 3 adenylate cyclase